MAGSVCLHYAAVEVCDRGTAGGESLAGERGARNKTVGQGAWTLVALNIDPTLTIG